MKTLLILISIFLTGTFPCLYAQTDSIKTVPAYDRHWEMQPGIYRVLKEGRTGVVNSSGRVLVPVEFDQVWSPENDEYIRVLKNRKTGLYHLERGVILAPEFDQIWPFQNGLAKVLKNRRFGFVNSRGVFVIPPEYQQVWSSGDDRFKVTKDGFTGFLSTDGSTIVPVIYQQIWNYHDGMARVLRDGKMGYIDWEGNEVIPAIYDHIWPFENDRARALKGGQQVMLNRKGHLLDVVDETEVFSPEVPTREDADTITVYQGRMITSRVKVGRNHIEIFQGPENDQRPKTKKPRRRFSGHAAGLGLAMNSYLNSNGKEQLPPGYEFMELNQGKALEVSIYPIQESVGLLGSWFGLTSSVGLQFNNYRFNINSYSDISGEGRSWFPEIDETAAVTKSKITTLYLNVPVMAELQLWNRHNRRPLYIAGGVIGGVKLQSHTKLVYHDEQGRHKRKKRDEMDLRSFRYGFTGKLGIGSFAAYGTYYPSSLFKSGSGPELYPFSVGVMFHFN